MTREAKSNQPNQDDVRGAFRDILSCHEQLATEKGTYMRRCREIREDMAAVYDHAKDKGVTKKVLKATIKEHLVLKKAEKARADLEADEQDEFDMIVEKLGDLAETPLGRAALKDKGKELENA